MWNVCRLIPNTYSTTVDPTKMLSFVSAPEWSSVLTRPSRYDKVFQAFTNVRYETSFAPHEEIAYYRAFKPVNHRYDHQFDVETYNPSGVGGISKVLSIIGGGHTGVRPEHRVSHVQFDGTLLHSGTSFDVQSNMTIDTIDYQSKTLVGNNGIDGTFRLNETATSVNTISRAQFLEHLEDILDVSFIVRNDSSAKVQFMLKSFHEEYRDESVAVIYTYWLSAEHQWGPHNGKITDGWYTASIEWTPNQRLSPTGHPTDAAFYSLAHFRYKCECTQVKGYGVDNPDINTIYDIKGWYVDFTCELTPYVETWADYSAPFPDHTIDLMEERLKMLSRRILQDSRTMLPYAYVSSTQAMDDMDRVLESNYLEFMSDIRDLQSLNAFDHFFEFLLKLVKKKGIGVIFHTIDFLASSVLLYEFGLRPTITDVREVARRWDEILRSFRAKHGESTIYSKVTRTLPIGSAEATVVLRSKIRLKIAPEHMLSSLRVLRATGLTPSLSNLWDLLPFSFVLDWFVNIGALLNTAGNGAHLLFAEIPRYVHSYTLYINRVSECYPSFTGTLSSKVYIREISIYFPMPNDYVLENELYQIRLPMLIGGSLVWVLINSG